MRSDAGRSVTVHDRQIISVQFIQVCRNCNVVYVRLRERKASRRCDAIKQNAGTSEILGRET